MPPEIPVIFFCQLATATAIFAGGDKCLRRQLMIFMCCDIDAWTCGCRNLHTRAAALQGADLSACMLEPLCHPLQRVTGVANRLKGDYVLSACTRTVCAVVTYLD